MEGATSLIVYLPEEEVDAQETRKRVEEHGGTCHLLARDVTKRENCREIVDEAVKKMGGLDILVNNAAFQNMVYDLKDLDEYVHTPLVKLVSVSAIKLDAHQPTETNGNTPSTQTSTHISTSQNTPSRTSNPARQS